ncbi:bifunctional adenosylcobinamide kinase/adenosylcobinamide-phosphate guanylyltransferase [soil metagenome]
MRELILGGQRSGKSRCAEWRARDWLGVPGREAVLIATALAGDAEMQARIARHRDDRAKRVAGLATTEETRALASAVAAASVPHRLVVVDCLTLWLTNLLMPMEGQALDAAGVEAAIQGLAQAVRNAPGPVVLVSNEIGMGLSPMTSEARHFVDELGRLHQAVAAVCSHVTLMVAGIELPVKRPAS